jgi:hypothetical protein
MNCISNDEINSGKVRICSKPFSTSNWLTVFTIVMTLQIHCLNLQIAFFVFKLEAQGNISLINIIYNYLY